MLNWKRLSGVLASALVLIMVVSACSGGGGGNTSGGSGETTGDTEFAAVTLKFQTIGNPQTDTARISKAASDHLKSIGKPYSVDIAIEDWGPYTDTVNLRLSTGEDFDIVFTANWAASYYTNAPNGVFTDLTPFLAKDKTIENILTPDFMNATQVNGKNYALPTNKEKARQVGWVLRKDIADQMGMDLSTVHSTKDLEPWFYKANAEHGLWVWNNYRTLDNMYDRIEEPIIGLIPTSDAKTVIACDLDSLTTDAIRLSNKWFKDGLMSPNLTTDTSGDSEFASGKYFAITYQLKPGKDKEVEAALGNQFELVQVETNTPQIANSETSGAMLAIPNASTHKNEAFDFIQLLYTDATLLNTIVWGQEGVDFDFVSDGVIQQKENSGWQWSNGWTLGDQFKNYLLANEDPQKWRKFNEFNEKGIPLASLGFVPDTTSTTMQTQIAAMKAIRENYFDFLTGYVDDIDGTLARLEADYKTAGMDELLAAYQAQFDAFLANK